MNPRKTTKSSSHAKIGWQQNTLTNSTKFAVALALFLAAIMAVAGGAKGNSSADAASLPFSAKPDNEAPVGAINGDRLYVRFKSAISPV